MKVYLVMDRRTGKPVNLFPELGHAKTSLRAHFLWSNKEDTRHFYIAECRLWPPHNIHQFEDGEWKMEEVDLDPADFNAETDAPKTLS